MPWVTGTWHSFPRWMAIPAALLSQILATSSTNSARPSVVWARQNAQDLVGVEARRVRLPKASG